MSSQILSPQRSERPLKGYHVLAMLVGFFVTVMGVNGYMMYEAIGTFGGVETADAYRKGVAYNKEIAASEAQASLGWSSEAAALKDQDGISVHVTDTSGAPVRGLAMTGEIGRGATERFDQTLSFRETEPGLYVARTEAALAPGQWIVSYTAEGTANKRYEMRRRVWITP